MRQVTIVCDICGDPAEYQILLRHDDDPLDEFDLCGSDMSTVWQDLTVYRGLPEHKPVADVGAVAGMLAQDFDRWYR